MNFLRFSLFIHLMSCFLLSYSQSVFYNFGKSYAEERKNLVVLFVCEIARGKVISKGAYDLQRAFKLAGVNNLIMALSLWKVDDDATQELMTNLYYNLLNGMFKRDALFEVQEKVRDTPGFEEPYYWTALVLLGGLN